jgi:hypothetical protein
LKPFLPRWSEPIAFAVMVTCIMTCIISGISTVTAAGLADPNFFSLWFRAWMSSWIVAAPILTFVAPAVRGLLRRMVLSADPAKARS